VLLVDETGQQPKLLLQRVDEFSCVPPDGLVAKTCTAGPPKAIVPSLSITVMTSRTWWRR
jgi:hypothetical protein